ncbi:MAG: glycosyltransferase family protein [Syntrophobacter sp.]
MKKKILYAIAGAGLGNFTRMLAVLGELDQGRFDIAIMAPPSVLKQVPPSFRTYSLEKVTYGAKSFSALNVLRNNISLPVTLRKNFRRCSRVFDEFGPDALIVDSDFHCLPLARKTRTPVISLNSSFATVKLFRDFRTSWSQMAFSYYCIERVDLWLQKRYADLIICPVIEPVEITCSKLRQINPIVRRQFLETSGERGPSREAWDIAVTLGGSGLGVRDIDLSSFTGKAVVMGITEGMKLPPEAKVTEFDPKPAGRMADARILVVQGGFNSISEVVALRKPSVLVPIPHHAEQFVNARYAEKLGIASVAWNGRVVEAIKTIEADYDKYLQSCRSLPVRCDGASQAARLIHEFLNV